MKDSTSGCFACNPTACHTQEEPPHWSQACVLCWQHKAACCLETGNLLSDVLRRAEPEGYPLEGSMLARIYNPVYVEADDRGTLKGWTDFSAGGMAVFEDRFEAQNYFDFFALENANAVSLLYVLERYSDPTSSHITPMEVIKIISRALSAEEIDGQLKASLSRAINRALGVLWGLWHDLEHISKQRAMAGKLWPDSYEELSVWLSLDREDQGMMSEAFSSRLLMLARRRFVPS